MAKAKPQILPENKTKKVKTYVSTSGIFMKVGSHRSIVAAPRQKLRHHEQYNHRFADELVSYAPKKHVQTSDHPLAAAFRGSTYPASVVVLVQLLIPTRAHRAFSRTHPSQRHYSNRISPPLSYEPPRKRQRSARQVDQSRHSAEGRKVSTTWRRPTSVRQCRWRCESQSNAR